MQIQASELPRQGFMGKFDAAKIEEVANHAWRHDKPKNGFWTSPFLDSGLTTWQDWCKLEMPDWFSDNVQTMEVQPNAKVFKIDGWQDLDWLWSEFGVGNWLGVASAFDAVWYTENAAGECRHDIGKGYDLYGVDIDSVVWFRDVFRKE